MHKESDTISQILDGNWTPVPHGETLASSNAARIYDATALISANIRPFLLHIDQLNPDNLQRYWHLPTKIAPILAEFLHSISSISNSSCEEIRLGILLRSHLFIQWNRIPSYPVHHKSSRQSEGDDGSSSEGGRGRDDQWSWKQSCKWRRMDQTQSHNVQHTSPRRQAHIGKPKQMCFDPTMTTDQIIFQARGCVPFRFINISLQFYY